MASAHHLAFGLLVGAAVAASTPAADACSPLPCRRAGLVPDGGSLPENVPGFVLDTGRYPSADVAQSPLELVRLDGAARTRVPATLAPRGESAFTITPATPWKAGERYALSLPNPCRYIGPERFEVAVAIGPTATAPGALGTLRASRAVRRVLRVGTASGSCSIDEEGAYVDVEATLDASAEPWRDVLYWETWVDGARYLPTESIGIGPAPGASWVGRGRDRIYTLCPADRSHGFPGVAPGRHQVELRARALGEGPTLTAGPIDVEVRCEGLPPSSEKAPPFAALPPPPVVAAGTSGAAGTDASAAPTPSAAPPQSAPPPKGCGCHLVSTERGAGALVVGLAAVAAAVGRRGRQRGMRKATSSPSKCA
ncbi:MAG: hypothetical protein IT373_21345 [Polyangiaceae bacterium]|nr:hypothetical protein [Polyangiaceae bacterium]